MPFHHRTIAPSHHRTVVLGGGIAGLTCALRLHQSGIPIALLEQSSHIGGCIRTIHEAGYLLELGPNTFLNSSTALWNLAESVGLKDLKVTTPPEIGKRRYVFKQDKLHMVPAGPSILTSSLLSIRGRLRMLKEPFVPRLQHAGTHVIDESLADFVRRRLGSEVLDVLVTPFVSGIYAGDPKKLSVRAIFPKLVDIEEKYGGIFRGMGKLKGEIKSSGLGSFRAGMGTLPSAIASQLGDSVVQNARVTAIERMKDTYHVVYEKDGEQKTILAKTVICALPAYVASQILEELSSEIGTNLTEIEYAPVVVIHTGYKKADIPRKLDGFGLLVPRKNRVRILGCLWSSALFPERATEGNALLTNFLGGMLDPEACDLSNDDIMRIIQKDHGKILKIKSPPEFACITRYTHAIPQYNIGHMGKIFKIGEALQKLPGLFLTGSYFNGISVATTIEHASMIADKVIRKK